MRNRALALVRAALVAGIAAASLSTTVMQAQQTTLPLWPQGTPEPPNTTAPEADVTKPTDGLINGHRTVRLTNVTQPELSLYQPAHNHTGTAVLVFPGGGYSRLAWTGEGLDACTWLNSLGVTCVLVKYRVPQPAGEAGHYPADPQDLEDAQQAMRLTRAHAQAWGINPHRIGVLGFSAGGNLAVLLSTHPDDAHVLSTPAAHEVPLQNGEPLDARADFAMLAYPAYLALSPAETELDPVYRPNSFTPPTFLVQAENDRHYGHNALVYYRALMDALLPAELHYFATGGHGFGVHPPAGPESHWTELAATWMRSIHALPEPGVEGAALPTFGNPCVVDAQTLPPTQPGQPRQPVRATNPNPNCW